MCYSNDKVNSFLLAELGAGSATQSCISCAKQGSESKMDRVIACVFSHWIKDCMITSQLHCDLHLISNKKGQIVARPI